MTIKLRDYQLDNYGAIMAAWNRGAKNILSVLPTGAGKTVIFTRLVADLAVPTVCIAHRQELVQQISLALSRNEVEHRIIGPNKVIQMVVAEHMERLGESYYRASAGAAVAGVDTLIRREASLKHWSRTVQYWFQDEAHHVQTSNKWGRGVSMFPQAKGLGVTATPQRADGKGLGRDSDGVFDTLIVGPCGRDLIDRNHLSDYRIFAPRTQDLNLDNINITNTGDFSRPGLRKAVQRSRIVGDIVDHYKRLAEGKLGITFVTDIDTATEVATAYNSAGVPAQAVDHKTSDADRNRALSLFSRGRLLQLVNVDLFGEGFDVPAVEVVSFGRPTMSYAVYAQQFGRSLRVMDGKPHAIIIDHVGNILRHGLPDARKLWSLNRRKRRESRGELNIKLKTCPHCTAVYERIFRECPECGFYAEPQARNGPEHVDGDLYEIDPAILLQMRNEVQRANMSGAEYRTYLVQRGCPRIALERNVKIHNEKCDARAGLFEQIRLWGERFRLAGVPDWQSYRKFYITFGVDVLGAQKLPVAESLALEQKIKGSL